MEKGTKIKISDYLLNRVMGKSQSLKISLTEKKYLLNIFIEDSYLNKKFPEINQIDQSIKLIDRNLYYDIYKFYYDKLGYAIKVGEKVDSFVFEREKNALESIKDLNLSPIFFNTAHSDNDAYLLTSFEHSQSSKELGLSYTYENIELLASSLAKIHNATKTEENEREYFIESLYSFSFYEEILGSETYEELKEVKNFKESLDLLSAIKKAIGIQTSNHTEGYSCLCHTDLNLSCILNRPEEMKICNFFDSFKIHPAWDLAFASYKLELDSHPIYEKRFLDAYHAESFLKEEAYSYVYYKQLAYKFILYKLVATYFFELLMSDSDSTNFLSLFKNYSYIRETIQDEFSEHMDMLDEMFVPYIKNL